MITPARINTASRTATIAPAITPAWFPSFVDSEVRGSEGEAESQSRPNTMVLPPGGSFMDGLGYVGVKYDAHQISLPN